MSAIAVSRGCVCSEGSPSPAALQGQRNEGGKEEQGATWLWDDVDDAVADELVGGEEPAVVQGGKDEVGSGERAEAVDVEVGAVPVEQVKDVAELWGVAAEKFDLKDGPCFETEGAVDVDAVIEAVGGGGAESGDSRGDGRGVGMTVGAAELKNGARGGGAGGGEQVQIAVDRKGAGEVACIGYAGKGGIGGGAGFEKAGAVDDQVARDGSATGDDLLGIGLGGGDAEGGSGVDLNPCGIVDGAGGAEGEGAAGDCGFAGVGVGGGEGLGASAGFGEVELAEAAASLEDAVVGLAACGDFEGAVLGGVGVAHETSASARARTAAEQSCNGLLIAVEIEDGVFDRGARVDIEQGAGGESVVACIELHDPAQDLSLAGVGADTRKGMGAVASDDEGVDGAVLDGSADFEVAGGVGGTDAGFGIEDDVACPFGGGVGGGLQRTKEVAAVAGEIEGFAGDDDAIAEQEPGSTGDAGSSGAAAEGLIGSGDDDAGVDAGGAVVGAVAGETQEAGSGFDDSAIGDGGGDVEIVGGASVGNGESAGGAAKVDVAADRIQVGGIVEDLGAVGAGDGGEVALQEESATSDIPGVQKDAVVLKGESSFADGEGVASSGGVAADVEIGVDVGVFEADRMGAEGGGTGGDDRFKSANGGAVFDEQVAVDDAGVGSVKVEGTIAKFGEVEIAGEGAVEFAVAGLIGDQGGSGGTGVGDQGDALAVGRTGTSGEAGDGLLGAVEVDGGLVVAGGVEDEGGGGWQDVVGALESEGAADDVDAAGEVVTVGTGEDGGAAAGGSGERSDFEGAIAADFSVDDEGAVGSVGPDAGSAVEVDVARPGGGAGAGASRLKGTSEVVAAGVAGAGEGDRLAGDSDAVLEGDGAAVGGGGGACAESEGSVVLDEDGAIGDINVAGEGVGVGEFEGVGAGFLEAAAGDGFADAAVDDDASGAGEEGGGGVEGEVAVDGEGAAAGVVDAGGGGEVEGTGSADGGGGAAGLSEGAGGDCFGEGDDAGAGREVGVVVAGPGDAGVGAVGEGIPGGVGVVPVGIASLNSGAFCRVPVEGGGGGGRVQEEAEAKDERMETVHLSMLRESEGLAQPFFAE